MKFYTFFVRDQRHMLSGMGWLFVCCLLSLVGRAGGSFAVLSQTDDGGGHHRPPPIDMHTVSPDSYEPGVFRIKFTPEVGRQLEEAATWKQEDGMMRTGVGAFDSLSQQHYLPTAKSLLDRLYEISPASRAYRDRHLAWGLHLWYEFTTSVKTEMPALLEAYASLPEVEVAEPVYKIRRIAAFEAGYGDEKKRVAGSELKSGEGLQQSSTWIPNDPEFADRQWSFSNTGQTILGSAGTPGADISMPEAWEIHKGSSQVIVAVIDGGVKYDHPDLAGNMWAEIGYNFVTNSSTITSDNHGTHVAGTVAAVSNNGTGVAGIAGGSGSGDGVRIMSLQVFASSGSGGFDLAFYYAADNGAAITQNSWGYEDPGVFNESMITAIDYFNTHGGGGIMNGGISIFAAGNDNSDGEWYPAYYGGAFAVAATTNRDQKSSTSNYGSWIDVSAPGSAIYSTRSTDDYGYMSGTSMACPHVTGVAALILSLAPGQYTAQQVAQIIRNTTDNHYAQNPDYTGLLGTGRLNAHAALLYAAGLMDNVANPLYFTALPSDISQINLNWQKNDSNNPVLLAWSLSDTFGTPYDGVAYGVGQSIPGGGTVIYAGSNASFSHTGLATNTSYYYKIWSVNPANEYSSGVSTSAKTLCQTVSLPIHELFSEGLMPPSCWAMLDNDGDNRNWFLAQNDAGYSPQTGDYAAASASYANASGPLTPDNWLITPKFSVPSNLVDIRFWVKAQDSGFPAETYSVLYSTTGIQPADFTPLFSETLSNTTWKENTVEMNNMAGQQVFVAFRHHGSTDQFEMLLDNIRIEERIIPTFSITATSGPHGSISPSGEINVLSGENLTFVISPNAGYIIQDVLVDGVSVGAVDSYEFTDVASNSTIHAVFSIKTYTIDATAGFGGSISPVGTVIVDHGENQTFTIIAQEGYHIQDVLVNGVSVGAVGVYAFNQVVSNQSIHAVFAINTYTVSAGAGSGGSISPEGVVILNHGQSQTFTINPDVGYHILDVFIDGSSVGPITSYTFENVTYDRSIQAIFIINTYTIYAFSGSGGGISPAGNISINHGQSQTFIISPVTGYHIQDVFVNGTNMGAIDTYTFTDVTDHQMIQAMFAINFYTISATSSTGGKISDEGDLALIHGQSQQYFIEPDEGYHIQDVFVNGISVGAVNTFSFIHVTTNNSIHAVFAINTYSLIAAADVGGVISPTGQVVVAHGDAQLFEITPQEGYHIAHVIVDGQSVGVPDYWWFHHISAPHSILALFAVNTYQIDASAGAGGNIFPAGQMMVEFGESQTYAITPDEGYHVLDVVVDGLSQGPVSEWEFMHIESDHSIEALFGINTYTLTAMAGAGGTISPTRHLEVSYGDSQTYHIVPDEGYHLLDVVVDGLSQGAVSEWEFKHIESDHSIEALFAINTYTLTATAGAGGTISPTGSLVVEYGESQTYAITPDEGYHVLDVVVDGLSQGAVSQWVFPQIESDHSIEALFAINTYTLTATAGAGGTISPTGSLVVEYGESQTYAIIPDEGYHVLDVLVDGLSQGAVSEWEFMHIETDHSIEALFAINTYTITATAGAGGTISPTGKLEVSYGDSQTYHIVPDEGYHVLDVVVDGLSQGAVSEWAFIHIESDHSIEALFAINTYTLTATSGAGGTISPTGQQVATYGDTQTYHIVPDEGYRVLDVMVDGFSQGAIANYTFIHIDSDHSIHAIFEEIPIPMFDVSFMVIMDYAEAFSGNEGVYLTGSMFGWEESLWMNAKSGVASASPIYFTAMMELPAGSYEYAYYLNNFPSGSEWESPPYRSFTVPDTLSLTDFFGYRTDPTNNSEITGSEELRLDVYPNPAKDKVTISAANEITAIQMFDIFGKLVVSNVLHDKSAIIDVSGLPAGLYFIRVHFSGISATQRIIIKP